LIHPFHNYQHGACYFTYYLW